MSNTKKLFDCFVLTTLVLFLLFVLLSSLGQGNTITVEDFEESPTALNWSSDKVSVTPSGERFLGPFGAETVTVVVPTPGNAYFAFLEFDVYAIGTWNDVQPATWIARQYVPSVDTTMLLTASSLTSFLKRAETNTLGYTLEDRVYHFRTFFAGDDEWYRAEFTGYSGNMQWGLDNVTVYVDAIPEPTTLVMIVGLLSFLALRRLAQ